MVGRLCYEYVPIPLINPVELLFSKISILSKLYFVSPKEKHVKIQTIDIQIGISWQILKSDEQLYEKYIVFKLNRSVFKSAPMGNITIKTDSLKKPQFIIPYLVLCDVPLKKRTVDATSTEMQRLDF